MEKIYKEEIQRLLPIFQAMEDGKTIQTKNENGWIDIDGDEDGLNLDSLISYPDCYRIKPEPKYRPFANAEECWTEMLRHEPFGWVKDNETHKFLVCKALGNILFFIGIGDKPYSYNEVLRDYTFADGTPFGVKLEE
jgi:hypothetical protein